MKKNHLLVALMIAITLGFIGTMGIHPASASDTATVYVYPAARPGPYSAGQVLTYRVQLDTRAGYGAPHETTEPYPGLSTDKTWAWEVVINYDNTVINVTTDPYRDSTRDWYNLFHKWEYDFDMMEWLDLGAYDQFYKGTSIHEKGEVAATCTLTEDIPSKPLPVDDMGEKSFPNAGLHYGDYYDLPYSDGLSGSPYYAYDYFILYIFRVTLLQDVGEGQTVPGTTLTINTAASGFFMYDKTSKYTFTAEDATIGVPEDPEFPLGLGLMMAIAPAIPIIYIWRRRKWVGKK